MLTLLLSHFQSFSSFSFSLILHNITINHHRIKHLSSYPKMEKMSAPSGGSMTWQAPPFTVAQWQELEHQALIFKYLKAGLTVPPDLLVPIQRSLQLMSPKLSHSLHYPSLGYYGKKIDPEPGRCRRTDGKKWRCSRDAHPDSKYCDRHMIRRRYRSRKPVESSSSSSQQQPPQPSTTSELATTAAGAGSRSSDGSGGGGGGASASASGTFHTLPLHTNGTREGFTLGGSNNNSSSNNSLHHFQMDSLSVPGEASKKEFRFSLTSGADEHDFLQKDLGSVRYQGYDFTSDGMWSMSHISSNAVSESRTSSTMAGNCFQQQTIRDSDLLNLNAARTKELVFSSQLSSTGCLKHEYQALQPLFSDGHWKKDSGSDAIEYRPIKDFNSDADVDCNGSL